MYQGRLRDKLEEYLPKFEDGTFKIYVEKVVSWKEIKEAHEMLTANTTKGKIIALVD